MHHRDKTHCKHGHEFTPDNTRHQIIATTGKKFRVCKACEQFRNKRSVDGNHEFERRRIVAWLREHGFTVAAGHIERGAHVQKRTKRVVVEMALERCRQQQQQEQSA